MWRVPYTVVTSHNDRQPVVKGVLTDRTVDVSLGQVSGQSNGQSNGQCRDSDWICVNPGQYRYQCFTN